MTTNLKANQSLLLTHIQTCNNGSGRWSISIKTSQVQAAFSFPYVHESVSELLAASLTSDTVSLDAVPEEYHVYSKLLPPEHATRFLANATTDAHKRYGEHAEVAVFLARLLAEPLYIDMAKLVGTIPTRDVE